MVNSGLNVLWSGSAELLDEAMEDCPTIVNHHVCGFPEKPD